MPDERGLQLDTLLPMIRLTLAGTSCIPTSRVGRHTLRDRSNRSHDAFTACMGIMLGLLQPIYRLRELACQY